MEIIDGQLHEFGPLLDWADASEAQRDDVLLEVSYAAIAAAGVDGAVLHPVGGIDWACKLAARFPDRFFVVPMVSQERLMGAADVLDPAATAATEQLAALLARPGVGAIRIVAVSTECANELHDEDRLRRGAFDRIFDYCEANSVPIFLNVVGQPELTAVIAERFPKLTLIVDHLAIPGPPRMLDSPWWKRLEQTLALAAYPNVNMKLSAVPAYSRTGYPFVDVQPQALEVVKAFGADRVMWGSDINRLHGRVGWGLLIPQLQTDYPGRHSYPEAIGFVKYADWLDDADKEKLLGGTARRLLKWPGSPA